MRKLKHYLCKALWIPACAGMTIGILLASFTLAATTSPAPSERIDLDFQAIPVRSVLQMIGELTHKNVIISESVEGNITLHLQNVPWQEALDLILKMQGLAIRESGNILMIAPAKELIAQDRSALQSEAEIRNLVPTQNDMFRIKYGKAEDYYATLKNKDNTFLSAKGRLILDKRTNTLFIEDTPEKLAGIRRYIEKTDIPVQQVEIEARIVTIDKSYERQLGIEWGAQGPSLGSNTRGFSLDLGANPIDGTAPGNLAFATLAGDFLLGLELSAIEAEGGGEILSSPKLLTADQQEALIEQGQEIPYNESTSSGAAAIAFKQAVLRLKVKPQITPDRKIMLNLEVNQDAIGKQTNAGLSIDTRKISTNVLVNDGQTVVLGGIYERNKTNTITRIPFISDVPVLGSLFQKSGVRESRKELLIFVTPHIISEDNR
jgi:type IV pilus assembly protein PilQ